MTATDELRKLLDEREVEWTAVSKDVTMDNQTYCYPHTFTEFQDGLMVTNLTPEQAIAATLGVGTCKNKATSLRTFWCDCCDCALEDWMDVGGKLVNGLRFCPNCGRKVEG